MWNDRVDGVWRYSRTTRALMTACSDCGECIPVDKCIVIHETLCVLCKECYHASHSQNPLSDWEARDDT